MKRLLWLVCWLMCCSASAETFYRCPGDVYQRAWCAGGKRIEIDPDINRWTPPKRGAVVQSPAASEEVAGSAVAIPRTPQPQFQAPDSAPRPYYTPSSTPGAAIR